MSRSEEEEDIDYDDDMYYEDDVYDSQCDMGNEELNSTNLEYFDFNILNIEDVGKLLNESVDQLQNALKVFHCKAHMFYASDTSSPNMCMFSLYLRFCRFCRLLHH